MNLRVQVRLTPRLDFLAPLPIGVGSGAYCLVLIQLMAVGTFLIASFLAAWRLLTSGGSLLQQTS